MFVKDDHGGFPASSFHRRIGSVVLKSPRKGNFTPNTTKSLKVSLKERALRYLKGENAEPECGLWVLLDPAAFSEGPVRTQGVISLSHFYRGKHGSLMNSCGGGMGWIPELLRSHWSILLCSLIASYKMFILPVVTFSLFRSMGQGHPSMS